MLIVLEPERNRSGSSLDLGAHRHSGVKDCLHDSQLRLPGLIRTVTDKLMRRRLLCLSLNAALYPYLRALTYKLFILFYL